MQTDALTDSLPGYDDEVIGGLLTASAFRDTFHLSSSIEGTVTALFVIGCLVGSLCTSFRGDISGIVAAVMLFAYQAFYTWGFMDGIWCYGPEILPLAHRSKGIGLTTGFLWLSTFVVMEIVPIAIDEIGWRTYIIFAAFNLAFVPMVYFLYPETAGFSLEAVNLAFMDQTISPVKKADELWKLTRGGHDVTLTSEIEPKDENVQTDHIEITR
ncbi:hypothetical protein NUU61_008431 [Penicillium alfredii]|uniref:Major facilitator superfamily (MFS) profile domain-containing protein n=1 Tax=Penicillium alfredii TaxID=1506179 RepID=A0A9W9JWQ0_9EURO|nr:uncharacterized protein NUU61_008431 [Penicillium alfredii]KAJ5083852.1 hypothetical protein NUU61_008431 [Penicillium alfredii]